MNYVVGCRPRPTIFEGTFGLRFGDVLQSLDWQLRHCCAKLRGFVCAHPAKPLPEGPLQGIADVDAAS